MDRRQQKYQHKATAHEYAIELLKRAHDNGICADEHPDIQKEFYAIIKRLQNAQTRHDTKSKETAKPVEVKSNIIKIDTGKKAIRKYGKRG
jgi:anti-sigma-K factor RskA